MSERQTTYHGVNFFGLLALLFIGLKLGGLIAWPWWWVLSPLWGPFVVLLGVLLLILIGWLCLAGWFVLLARARVVKRRWA